MTDLEVLMWRLAEWDPIFRSTMMMVAVLDQPVDRTALTKRVWRLTASVARLRDRIKPGVMGSFPPRWERDPSFDLDFHVRWVPAGEGDLLEVAEDVDMQRFDPDRPPWQVTFVDGLGAGRQGVILRLHHSYTDGLGALRLAGELFDLERTPPGPGAGSGRPEPGGSTPAGSSGSPGPRRVVGEVGGEVRRQAVVLSRAVPWAARTVRGAFAAPQAGAEALGALARSTLEQVGLAGAPSSPVLTGRSAGARFASIDLDLEAMRAAGRRAGRGERAYTVNDVFVSGLLGGVARYHAKHQSAHQSLRVGMPISTRSDGSAHEMRNQLEGTFFLGPLDVDEPLARTRRVGELVERARDQPLLALIGELSALGARLPFVTQAIGWAARGLDLVASNVPGPPVRLYLGGARVDRLVPFGPRGGSALNATLLSYDGRVHVGLNIDPRAAPDASLLAECVRDGFDELCGASQRPPPLCPPRR